MVLVFFFFNDTATTEIYTLSLHDALPILVRYWKDVAGQEKRQQVYERICPISGPGKLSASERERKAKEIIAASGVDTQEYFDKVVTQSSNGVTFREQADTWLEGMRNRRRKQPLAP